MRYLRLLDPVARPCIVTRGDLLRYVALVTGLGLLLALSIDIVNQLTFFESWTVALRSWTLTVVSVLLTAIPVATLIGRAQRELYEAKRRVEQLSRTDVLTGLPNRRALLELADTSAAQVMVLVIADIDRFKQVNDTFGHRAGDTVIQVVGQLMAAHLAPLGMVGRLGGEEFAVFAPFGAAASVLAALERFHNQLAAHPIAADGVAINVTISAGAAVQARSTDFAGLYAEADAALYRAKNAGRNRIELSPALRDLVEGRGEEPGRRAA